MVAGLDGTDAAVHTAVHLCHEGHEAHPHVQEPTPARMHPKQAPLQRCIAVRGCLWQGTRKWADVGAVGGARQAVAAGELAGTPVTVRCAAAAVAATTRW